MTGAGRPRSAEAFRDRYFEADLELAFAGIETFLKADHRDVGELADADVGVLGTLRHWPSSRAIEHRRIDRSAAPQTASSYLVVHLCV